SRTSWLSTEGGLLFFSSRRRHTRFSRDWSSDVCSSDLNIIPILIFSVVQCASGMSGSSVYADTGRQIKASMIERQKEKEHNLPRSEERRVGKEYNARGPADAGRGSGEGRRVDACAG